MSNHLWRISLAVLACAVLTACNRSSSSESAVPVGPSSTSAASFGTLVPARTVEAGSESKLARCLGGSVDGACFEAATAPGGRMTIASRSPVAPAADRGGAVALADTAPNPPTNLSSSVFKIGASSQVDLFWSAPTTGPTPTNYRIEAGSAPGLNDLAAFDTANANTFFFTTVSGSGTFYVRVRSVVSGVVSNPSNEVVITLLSSSLPSAPFLSTPQVVGSTVTLSWFLSSSSPAVTSYVLQASSRAGGPPDLANFATGNTATSLTATGVPPGTYFVRVLGANNAGIGPASNEVSFIVLGTAPCTAAPSAPSNLVSSVSGSTVTLGWSPSVNGPPASYVIEAGSATGLANLAVADTGNTNGTATFAGVGRGSYYVRVRGKNACGTGGASNEIVVTVQ